MISAGWARRRPMGGRYNDVVLALWILSPFVMGACADGDQQPSRAALEARLGESFTLRVGESVRVEHTDLTVTFEEVARDSRCPKDVTCIRAGEAVVHLSLAPEGGEKSVVELTVPPGGSSVGVNWNSFVVTVVALNPEKDSRKSIDRSAYVVTVKLTRT